MKTILFCRHAKSSWSDPSQIDFNRPLNERGQRDAPFMAQLLREQHLPVDAIIASSAQRTRQTAAHYATGLGINTDKIIFDNNIYDATQGELWTVIAGIDTRFQTVLLVGHNPGMGKMKHSFQPHESPYIPTCSIFQVQFEAVEWWECSANNATVQAFWFPKMFV